MKPSVGDFLMIRNDRVLSFVMAGGRGSRLKVLTKDTCKPAISILGHHRIFDADSVSKTVDGIERYNPDIVLVLGADMSTPLREQVQHIRRYYRTFEERMGNSLGYSVFSESFLWDG